MTAEVDPRAEVSLVQEKLADASAYVDFPKGGARDCDINAHLEDNEIDRDGDYGSYVMVNGSDAVSDDSVQVDPNAEGELECFGADSIEIDPDFEVAEPRIKNEIDAKSCVSEESGGVSQVVEKALGESASDCQMNEFEVRNNVSNGDQKQGEEIEMDTSEKVKEITNSQNSVCETADYHTNYPQANGGEEIYENKNRLDSNGSVGEPEISIPVVLVDGFVPDQNGDVVHEADNGNKLNASPNANDEDTAYGKNSLVLKENQLDENGKDSVIGQSGEEKEDLEKNLEPISTNEANSFLEREKASTNDDDAADKNEQDFVVGQLKEEEEDLEKNLPNVSTNEAIIVLERDNANASDEDALDEKNILILEEKHLDENIEDSFVGQSGEEEGDLENNLTTDSTTEANILMERENANANDEGAANDKSDLISEENHLDENVEVPVVGQSEEEEDPEKNLENVSTDEVNIVCERENANSNDEDATNEKYIVILEENHVDEKKEDFAVGQAREEEDVLEKNFGSVSTDEANILSEKETFDNQDCLAARQDQDEDPQTAEVVNCVSASDGCEIVSSEKSCTDLGVTDTNMDIMAGGPSEEHDDLVKSLEKNTVTDPCLTDDKYAQAEGSISGEEGNGLPTSPYENKASNSSNADNLVISSQNMLEENRQPENTERTPSVMVGSLAIDCKEMFPSLPFNNAAIKSFLKAKTSTSQELSSSAVKNVKLDKEVKNVSERTENPDSSCLLDATVEAKPANGTVEEDTQSSILGDDEGKLNTPSDGIEFESNGSTCQEVKVTDEIHRDVCVPTLEHLSHDTAEVQDIIAEVASGPFYFIRFPRYEDDIIREKIKHAQSQVDQKTRIRESFQAQIQTAKATCKEFGSNLDAAKSDGKAARDSLKTKRKEIDSAQSVINKAKNAMSIDDIGIRINKLEHMIAHETLPLKEEKQLIREIKQWSQLRDQLSLDAGKQSELQLALDQKDQIEERLTVLRKEADLVKDNVLKADALTMSVKKMYDGERGKFNELQSQFEAANKIRQEAYAHLQCLKQPYKEKLNYFGKYKNDIEEAKNLALSKDRVKLQRHAVNQVETFMERWNKDDEFRKDYVRCNVRSTLRRLGTFDGRSLGPDEEPPVLNNIVKGRAATDNSVSLGSTVEQDKQAVHVETVKDNLKPAKVDEKKDPKSKTKNPVAVVVTKANKQKTVSSGVEVVETRDSNGVEVVVGSREEEDKRSKEEDEVAKRAEELRKEEEAVRLKEQLKLEEKAKAKDALERKKRLAEKAQARAVIKAQKEAEEREREKEKKAMRKERKKIGGGGEPKSDAIEEESVTPAETQKEPDTAEKPKTGAAPKKPQKRSQFSKQNKASSIPPPLRKRGKRKMETWMWILVTVVVVLVLFFLGNGGALGKLGMGNFSFKI